MTAQPDPVDALLAGSLVPAMTPSLATRIVEDAQRAGRRPASAFPPPRRRSRARRAAWTAVIALNVLVASTMAAAIGGARFVPEQVVAATHRIVERLRPHLPAIGHSETQRVPPVRIAPRRIVRVTPVAPYPASLPRPLPPSVWQQQQRALSRYHPRWRPLPRPAMVVARPRAARRLARAWAHRRNLAALHRPRQAQFQRGHWLSAGQRAGRGERPGWHPPFAYRPRWTERRHGWWRARLWRRERAGRGPWSRAQRPRRPHF